MTATDVPGSATMRKQLTHILAARALRLTDRTVAAIGADLGYTSESAFSNAFKRVLGQSPSRYRSAHASAGTR